MNRCRSGFGRCNGRACRAAPPPAAFVERVRRLLSGESAQAPTVTPLQPLACRCTFDPKAVFHLAVEGGAPWGDRVFVLAFGYLVANRFGPSKHGAEVLARRRAHSRRGRLHPAAALDRGAAVLELERRQGAGILLRWAHRGAAQLAGRDQRAAGRRAHLRFLLQRQGHRHRHDRAQTERGRRTRRQCAALSEHHPHHRAADQCGHGLSPVVQDL